MAVLGIDVSKADFHAFLIAGEQCSRKSFPNSPAGFRAVRKWLANRKLSEVHACMEATGACWLQLARSLHAAGFRVSVVNPSRTALFARSQLRRTKTDAVDAKIIAEFCRTQQPALWSPPAPEILTLRGFLTYRDQLVAQHTALKQLISQVQADATLQRLHRAHLDVLEDTIASLQEQIGAHVDAHPDLQVAVGRVRSICGFGTLTAAAIVAKLPVERLRSGKAAAAYAGLSPREWQSGSSIRGKTRICKTGNAELRRDLFMPALVAMRFNPDLRVFADRLKARGKPGKVVVVAVMRKLLVLAFTLLKTGTSFRPATRATHA
jgi:transposase